MIDIVSEVTSSWNTLRLAYVQIKIISLKFIYLIVNIGLTTSVNVVDS